MSKATSPTIGKIGQGLKFNGSSSYISLAYSSSFAFTSNMTVSAWVYLPNGWSTSNTVTGMIVKSQDNNAGFSFFMGGANTGQAGFWIHNAGYLQTVSAKTNWNPGWYFLTGTYDGSHTTFYVNGVQNGTPAAGTGNIVNKSQALSIGYDYPDAGYYFSGTIDDVRIYNRRSRRRRWRSFTRRGSRQIDYAIIYPWHTILRLLRKR